MLPRVSMSFISRNIVIACQYIISQTNKQTTAVAAIGTRLEPQAGGQNHI
jgi:hypothetical protein